MDFTNVAKKTGQVLGVTLLSGVVMAAPYAKAGCERLMGYPEARCGDVADAAQNLPKLFFTSTATDTLL